MTGGSFTTDDRLRAAVTRWEPAAEGIRIRRDDDLLNAAVVACVWFGVLYSIVLDVVRASGSLNSPSRHPQHQCSPGYVPASAT